ncbi:MAG: hypothetical protein JO061_04390 [Acidobacteriaceae bacterium]|nr:hypothetical protein [Acidobacteriaceae bacterium]
MQKFTLTAKQRIQQVKNAQTNFYLGLAALALLQNHEHYGTLDHVSASIDGKYGFKFSEAVKLLDHPEAGQYARQEFLVMLFRMMLKEPFEVVKAYAEDNGVMNELQRQPWFHVARLLRNAVSHDFMFTFRPFDLTLLPLEWNGIRIDAGMSDKHVAVTDVPIASVKELVSKLRAFLEAYVRKTITPKAGVFAPDSIANG